MKLLWMILAGICILAAVFFLLRGELNTAFVVAALGIMAWFLNYRVQMKAIIATVDREQSNEEDYGKDGEDSNDDWRNKV